MGVLTNNPLTNSIKSSSLLSQTEPDHAMVALELIRKGFNNRNSAMLADTVFAEAPRKMVATCPVKTLRGIIVAQKPGAALDVA